MTSDDTEHTCLTAQALLRHPDDPGRFARRLAWGLRGWLAGLAAGAGYATVRACLKLWLGFPPTRSGVWSAGNGPAMRAAVLGACLGEDAEKRRAFVRASTRLTHTDPRAEGGAQLVALAAHHGAASGPGVEAGRFLEEAREVAPDDEKLAELLDHVEMHLARRAGAAEFAAALGLRRGVSGYVYHTVPVVLFAWLRWPGDLRRAVEEVIALGGDSDTTGAILGGVAGATLGASAIPPEWLRLCEWPRSVGWMRRLAGRLAQTFPDGKPAAAARPGPLPLFWPGLPPRNLFFLAVVLGHVFRRLLPPYRGPG